MDLWHYVECVADLQITCLPIFSAVYQHGSHNTTTTTTKKKKKKKKKKGLGNN